MTFIVLWLLGDLTNLFGAVMAKLLPTMIILAIYVGPRLLRNIHIHDEEEAEGGEGEGGAEEGDEGDE